MTNEEKSEKLFSEAERIYLEAKNAFADKSWNLSIRRSQEVVELQLKGLLYLIGVDYPKIHDVTVVFIKALEDRKIETDPQFLSWLSSFSSDLALKRAPAFYFEENYDEETAHKIIEGMEKVREFTKNLLKRLKR